MKPIEPKRLKGFRDFLPEQMANRLRIVDVVRRQASLAGFQAVGTPVLEYAPVLLGQGSDETDKQVYKFEDHGGRAVAMRFDLTVPFARFVAEHYGQLHFPFKRMQIGEVWRGENTQKGRYREFGQCDLDVIGIDNWLADYEVLNTFGRIIAALNIGPVTFAVGHRYVLSTLIKHYFGGTPSAAQEEQALIAIDKLQKIGADKVSELLQEKAGFAADGAAGLMAFIAEQSGGKGSDLAVLENLLRPYEGAAEACQRLRQTVTALTQSCQDLPVAFVCDIGIARGLGYYTGVVFETTLDELPGFGSICSGGRYNDLASRFSTRELPGVGGSIGLDRLLAALEELGRMQPYRPAQVLVAMASDDVASYALSITERMRALGISCDIGLQRKLGQQFKHADRLGCQVVLTVGGTEQETNTVSVKVLASGQEMKQLSLQNLEEALRPLLK